MEHLAVLGYRMESSIPPGIDFRDRSGLRGRSGPIFGATCAPAPRSRRVVEKLAFYARFSQSTVLVDGIDEDIDIF